MRIIYKYPLEIVDQQVIEIPMRHRIIHVGLDPQGIACIWAETNTDNEKHPYLFFVVGTGNPIPRSASGHIGSFVMGSFVWHVYKGSWNG